MRKLSLGAVLAVLALAVAAQGAGGDDAKKFYNKARPLTRKIKSSKKKRDSLQEKFCILQDKMERMGSVSTLDPKAVRIAQEHEQVVQKLRKTEKKLTELRKELVEVIKDSLSADSKEIVQAALEMFCKGRGYPDAFAEHAVLEGLKGIKNENAKSFMLEELKNSRRKSARKLICDVLSGRREAPIVEALVGMLADKDWEIVTASARAIAISRAKSAVEPMLSAFERAEKKKDGGAMRGLRQALGEMTGEYLLETAGEFRKWWEGKGKQEYNENAYIKRRGLGGKGGPQSLLYGEIRSKKVVFVCDVSPNMTGRGVMPSSPTDSPDEGATGGEESKEDKKKQSRMDIMKKELTDVIEKRLPDGAMFNIISYATLPYRWQGNLTEASQRSRGQAAGFVKSMDTNPIGLANVYGALKLAFSDKDVETIYLLASSDPTVGTATEHLEVLTAVRHWNEGRNLTIHTIGLLVGKYDIDEDHTSIIQFLKDLALQNGGGYRIFEEE